MVMGIHRTTTTIALLAIIALFIFPIALLIADVIPIAQRFWVLIAVVGAAAIVARSNRWSWRDLGCRADNVRSAVIPYTLFAAVGVVLVIAVAGANGRQVMLVLVIAAIARRQGRRLPYLLGIVTAFVQPIGAIILGVLAWGRAPSEPFPA
jgi:hypothetical protein